MRNIAGCALLSPEEHKVFFDMFMQVMAVNVHNRNHGSTEKIRNDAGKFIKKHSKLYLAYDKLFRAKYVGGNKKVANTEFSQEQKCIMKKEDYKCHLCRKGCNTCSDYEVFGPKNKKPKVVVCFMEGANCMDRQCVSYAVSIALKESDHRLRSRAKTSKSKKK